MVAGMAVFENGRPKNSHYRRFKIKTVPGNDDFASMREVLTRRFKRLQQANGPLGTNGDESKIRQLTQSGESERPDLAAWDTEQPGKEAQAPADGGKSETAAAESFRETPDLVLIDGGKGQLSAALQVFLQMGLKDIPLASLAKQQEEIYVPERPDPVVLPRNSQALFLVQRARDEAHRFAVTFHRERRQSSSMQSALDLVPGIGPKRKRALIRTFGSAKGIKDASVEELAAAPGMTVKLAEKIKQYL
jgi:excinuclease ABC subunit C